MSFHRHSSARGSGSTLLVAPFERDPEQWENAEAFDKRSSHNYRPQLGDPYLVLPGRVPGYTHGNTSTNFDSTPSRNSPVPMASRAIPGRAVLLSRAIYGLKGWPGSERSPCHSHAGSLHSKWHLSTKNDRGAESVESHFLIDAQDTVPLLISSGRIAEG